jgi:hypothetical protein
MMRRRVIEANDAADDRRRFAASAMPENLLAIADQLAGRVQQFHCGRSRGADQTIVRLWSIWPWVASRTPIRQKRACGARART